MITVLAVFPVALLLLACPLMMLGMPVVMWVTSRIKGEKKPMSMNCMPGHGENPSQSTDASTDSRLLRDQVAQMEREIRALRSQLESGSDAGPNRREEHLPTVPEPIR